jgi:hypothetical protein
VHQPSGQKRGPAGASTEHRDQAWASPLPLPFQHQPLYGGPGDNSSSRRSTGEGLRGA